MKRVLCRPQAARDLERLPNRERDQVEDAIERFVQTGSGDVKMLTGEGRQLRLRVGDWRVRFIYEKPDIIRMSVAAKWSPARGAVRSEPFPLLRSVVRNGPEPSRARRCWARRSEPLTARTVLRRSGMRERRSAIRETLSLIHI